MGDIDALAVLARKASTVPVPVVQYAYIGLFRGFSPTLRGRMFRSSEKTLTFVAACGEEHEFDIDWLAATVERVRSLPIMSSDQADEL